MSMAEASSASKASVEPRTVGTPIALALVTSGLGFALNYGFQIEALRLLTSEGFYVVSLWLSYYAMLAVAGNVAQNFLVLRSNQTMLARLRWPTIAAVIGLGALHVFVRPLSFGASLVESTALTALLSAWLGLAFGAGAWIAAYLPSTLAFVARLVFVEIMGRNGPLHVIDATPISLLVALAFVVTVFHHVPPVAREPAPLGRSLVGATLLGFVQAGAGSADLVLAKVRGAPLDLQMFARVLLVTRVPLLVALALLNMTLGRHAVAHRNGTRDLKAERFERWLALAIVASAPIVALLLPYVPGLFRGLDAKDTLFPVATLSMLDHGVLVALLVQLHRAHARETMIAQAPRLAIPIALLVASAWLNGLSLAERLTMHLALYTSALVLVTLRNRRDFADA